MFSSHLHVITVSDRAVAGVYPDLTGPRAVELLQGAFPEARVSSDLVVDGVDSVSDALARGCAAGARIILTLGGTGLAARDLTVEGTQQLIYREIPGIAESLRAAGMAATPRAMFSRGIAGVIQAGTQGNGLDVVVINVAGSPNAAETACEVLIPVIPHLLGQLGDDEHRAAGQHD